MWSLLFLIGKFYRRYYCLAFLFVNNFNSNIDSNMHISISRLFLFVTQQWKLQQLYGWRVQQALSSMQPRNVWEPAQAQPDPDYLAIASDLGQCRLYCVWWRHVTFEWPLQYSLLPLRAHAHRNKHHRANFDCLWSQHVLHVLTLNTLRQKRNGDISQTTFFNRFSSDCSYFFMFPKNNFAGQRLVTNDKCSERAILKEYEPLCGICNLIRIDSC